MCVYCVRVVMCRCSLQAASAALCGTHKVAVQHTDCQQLSDLFQHKESPNNPFESGVQYGLFVSPLHRLLQIPVHNQP